MPTMRVADDHPLFREVRVHPRAHGPQLPISVVCAREEPVASVTRWISVRPGCC